MVYSFIHRICIETGSNCPSKFYYFVITLYLLVSCVNLLQLKVSSGYFPYFCRKLKGLKPLAFCCFSPTDLGRVGRMRAGAFPLSCADRCGCMGREDGDLQLSFLPSARLPLAGR